MPNSRKTNKRHRGAWLEPDVIERLRDISKSLGTDFTGLLERIGKGEVTVTPANTERSKKDNEKAIR